MTLTDLARIAGTMAFAALRVALCAVLLLSVHAGAAQARHLALPFLLTSDLPFHTGTGPVVGDPFACRARATLTGNPSVGSAPLPSSPDTAVPESLTRAVFAAACRSLIGACVPLRSGRGPPARSETAAA